MVTNETADESDGFPWLTVILTTITAVASTAITVVAALSAASRWWLKDIRQELLELRKGEREEHRDVWTVHHGLYQTRIHAAYEALGREPEGDRQERLRTRHRDAVDEYLDLLDRAVKFPEIIDPSLSDKPEYVDFLRGRLEEAVPGGLITKERKPSPEERDDLQEILKRLERLASTSESADDYILRGNAYYKAGLYDEALAALSRALGLRSDDPDTLWSRGATLDALERYEDALADYNRALELRPDHMETLNNRGNTLSHLGRYDDALADFTRAFQLHPNHPTILYNRSCLYSLWQKPDEAFEDLGRAIEGDAKYRDMARTDEDLDNIRSDPRFRELVGEDGPPSEDSAGS